MSTFTIITGIRIGISVLCALSLLSHPRLLEHGYLNIITGISLNPCVVCPVLGLCLKSVEHGLCHQLNRHKSVDPCIVRGPWCVTKPTITGTTMDPYIVSIPSTTNIST